MIELKAFGMSFRGDFTSPATSEIQSGPPTLVMHQSFRPGTRQRHSRKTSPDQSIEDSPHL